MRERGDRTWSGPTGAHEYQEKWSSFMRLHAGIHSFTACRTKIQIIIAMKALKFNTNIMFLDIIHHLVLFKNTFWRLDSVSVFR
jgi:hypothetical protein